MLQASSFKLQASVLERAFSERRASFQNERAGGGRTNSQHNHGSHPIQGDEDKKNALYMYIRLQVNSPLGKTSHNKK